MIIYTDKQHANLIKIFSSIRKVYDITFTVLKIALASIGVLVGGNFFLSREWAGVAMCLLVVIVFEGLIWNAHRRFGKFLDALGRKDYIVDRTRCIKRIVKSRGDNDYSTLVKVEGYDKAIGLETWYIAGWHNLKEGDEVDVIKAAGEKHVIKALQEE